MKITTIRMIENPESAPVFLHSAFKVKPNYRPWSFFFLGKKKKRETSHESLNSGEDSSLSLPICKGFVDLFPQRSNNDRGGSGFRPMLLGTDCIFFPFQKKSISGLLNTPPWVFLPMPSFDTFSLSLCLSLSLPFFLSFSLSFFLSFSFSFFSFFFSFFFLTACALNVQD